VDTGRQAGIHVVGNVRAAVMERVWGRGKEGVNGSGRGGKDKVPDAGGKKTSMKELGPPMQPKPRIRNHVEKNQPVKEACQGVNRGVVSTVKRSGWPPTGQGRRANGGIVQMRGSIQP